MRQSPAKRHHNASGRTIIKTHKQRNRKCAQAFIVSKRPHVKTLANINILVQMFGCLTCLKYAASNLYTGKHGHAKNPVWRIEILEIHKTRTPFTLKSGPATNLTKKYSRKI